MEKRVERITPAFRGVMYASWPLSVWWGRLEVTGLEHIPLTGPCLLAGDHDSYWDTVTTGIAAMPRRQIRALAKSTMWNNALLGKVLDGMGQIPIDRGKGDAGALDRAVEELQKGAMIGIYPEGTRSLGRQLRARSGLGRLLERAPANTTVVLAACTGTTDIPKFPFKRPRVKVAFFPPAGGGLQPGESAAEFSVRILAELRERAPIEIAGRKRARRLIAQGWTPELAAAGWLPEQPVDIGGHGQLAGEKPAGEPQSTSNA
jgi:1-acyl-sn-glycerol-3-phosphate acyltransferase